MKKTIFRASLAMFSMLSLSIFAANCGICDPCSICTCDYDVCEFEVPCPPAMCAYNACDNLDLNCSWDVFASASYLYWEAKEYN